MINAHLRNSERNPHFVLHGKGFSKNTTNSFWWDFLNIIRRKITKSLYKHLVLNLYYSDLIGVLTFYNNEITFERGCNVVVYLNFI